MCMKCTETAKEAHKEYDLVRCTKCTGDGIYRWGTCEIIGTNKDGTSKVKVSNQGTCFTCGGKGKMTYEDTLRNTRYWSHYVKIY